MIGNLGELPTRECGERSTSPQVQRGEHIMIAAIGRSGELVMGRAVVRRDGRGELSDFHLNVHCHERNGKLERVAALYKSTQAFAAQCGVSWKGVLSEGAFLERTREVRRALGFE